MLKTTLRTLVAVSALAMAGSAFAQKAEIGSSAEAKAMLEKAVAAVKGDKAKALTAFNAGTDGFKDRDLYPFCGNASDGQMVAHPSEAIRKLKLSDIKDKNNFALGAEMVKVAKEGAIAEVAYVWPKPSGGDPVAKVSYVTKAGDLICGVGYYK
ncbi:MAG: cache domain-containing protein [Hyphomicrobiaceae bacterium]|nr:chemotaxis protein [Hyphomicrobiaceae bacterium]